MFIASEDATAAALVNATYGLVIATGLLVIATGVPIVQRIRDRANRNRAQAARVVPDLNMLLSRTRAVVQLLLVRKSAPLGLLDQLITDGRHDQQLAAKLKEHAASIGLDFSKEVYIARHFVTMALGDLYLLARAAEKAESKKSKHDLDDNPPHHHSPGAMSEEARLAAICAHYKAVEISLTSAESLLPKSVRTVDGGTFWERYAHLVDEREEKAQQALVTQRAQARKRP